MFKRVAAYIYYLFQRFVIKNEFKANMGLWFALEGDNKYLCTHKLDKNSVVFDVGGYTGVFTDKIINKYSPFIYVFEPVEKYIGVLKKRYVENEKIKILEFGLSDKTETTNIKLADDNTSVFIDRGIEEEIKLVDIAAFLKEYNIEKVDLISINIEGGEYPLLERIISQKIATNFEYVQVQFHNFIKGSKKRRKEIIEKLLKTHEPTFSFPYVWEGFKLKK